MKRCATEYNGRSISEAFKPDAGPGRKCIGARRRSVGVGRKSGPRSNRKQGRAGDWFIRGPECPPVHRWGYRIWKAGSESMPTSNRGSGNGAHIASKW